MRLFNVKKSGFALALIISFTFFGFHGSAGAGEPTSLPKTMLWSCFDVGSTGYLQASAIANAFVTKYGTRIRLLPSGTAIGRLMPLATRKVMCGLLANEVYFAVEGLYDFSAVEWGPQDLRMVLAHRQCVGLATTKKSGIKTLKDFKGKRVSWVPGSPSLNVKVDAFLAFGGLTRSDVKVVKFPNYASALRGLIQGKTDGSIGGVSAAIFYELDSSPKGLYWPPTPPEDKEGWKRITKQCPFFAPLKETVGAGLSKENAVWLPSYRYPMITVYADMDPDVVYSFIKALDATYPMYEKATPVMPEWKIIESGVPPADAPFHEGAIRYLKEKGVWKAKHQAWNDERLEHIKNVQKAWEKAREKAEAKKMKSKVFPEFWLKERATALGE